MTRGCKLRCRSFSDSITQFAPTQTTVGLLVLHEGACSLFEVRQALGRNRRQRACSDPRRLYEKNPICTLPRNVTYTNPFEALCERPAGGLREKVGGLCGSTTQRQCEKAHNLSRLLLDAGPRERVQHLACGNDMRTYRSPYHLECSKRFNVRECCLGRERGT